MSTRNLTLDDIADARAYEREREEFREHIKALKLKRRVEVGPFVSLVFENRDTIRFQIQEMARVEKILTDEGIQTEIDIYGALIPEPGHLAATLFLELTSEGDLRLWLPELIGIERSVELRIGECLKHCDALRTLHCKQVNAVALIHHCYVGESSSILHHPREILVDVRTIDHQHVVVLGTHVYQQVVHDAAIRTCQR